MPGAAMRDVGQCLQSESGEAHFDGGEAHYALRTRDGEAEHCRSADVLPGQVHGSDTELGDELGQVFGARLAVVLTR
jgi:hypothetical protein